MMRTALLVCTLAVFCSACSKNKPVATTLPTHDFLAPFVEPERTDAELAEEMEFVLLKLKRVHFGLDSAVLTVESRLALREARSVLVNYPDAHIYVEGHADSYGSSEYNISLAEKRATAVCDYLAALGMRVDHLHVISWGEEKPLVPDVNATAHAINRRVEFRLKDGDFELETDDGDLVAVR